MTVVQLELGLRRQALLRRACRAGRAHRRREGRPAGDLVEPASWRLPSTEGYFRDTPSGSSGGLVCLPDGVLVFSSHGGLRQPEPNGWSGRGEKSVTRATAGLA